MKKILKRIIRKFLGYHRGFLMVQFVDSPTGKLAWAIWNKMTDEAKDATNLKINPEYGSKYFIMPGMHITAVLPDGIVVSSSMPSGLVNFEYLGHDAEKWNELYTNTQKWFELYAESLKSSEQNKAIKKKEGTRK